jgi:hypothetical protein
MLKFTFQDGATLRIATSATVMTNVGPMLASAVTIGAYVRCGTVLFCCVDDIAVL